ncbi:MAG: TRAP transporter substrate-binding protein DctP [Rhodospirillales bacterium]|nr:TRAP transporter substrate-binding protein DctP [Rhodospirillales bacterium]
MKMSHLLLAACGVVAVMAAPLAEASDKIVLRFSSVSPPPGQSLDSDGVKWWMDKVTERTKGAVTFETFWGASLASGPAHIEILQKGMVDVIMGCRIYTPGKTPLGPFLYAIPFGPTDMKMVGRAVRQMHDEFPALMQEVEAQNGILLANFVTMPYQIASKTPFQSLDQVQGKKIGLIGRYFGRWAKVVGLVPVVAPMHERYTLLQSGVTDMDFHPITHMNAFKVQELAKNLVEVNAMVGNPWDLMMNLKKFKSLPADIQKILLDTGREAEVAMTDELAPKAKQQITDAWTKQGVTFTKLSEEERTQWAAKVEDIPAEWAAEMAAKGLPGWEMMARFQEIAAQNGYKWPRQWAVKK